MAKDNKTLHLVLKRKWWDMIESGKKKANQSPYVVKGIRLFDKVKYNGIECFVYGRRASGSFDIRKMDSTKVHAGVSFKKLKLLEVRKDFLITKISIYNKK